MSIHLKLICCVGILIGFIQSTSFARVLGMNDVTQLLPLPTISEFDLLLKPDDHGTLGDLLPYEAFRLLPVLSDQADQDQLFLKNLKVIGIRFDPCFKEGVAPANCRPQIRMIWQPLVIVGQRVVSLDTAIHTFHEFTNEEFNGVIADLRLLNPIITGQDVLSVQPSIQFEGFHGNYWKELKNLVLRHCGEQNLIRITVMTVRMSRLWAFSGLDRNGLGWKVIHIPTLVPENPVSQTFMLTPSGMQNLEEFAGGVSILPKAEVMWMRMASDSMRFKELEKETDIRTVVRRAIRLENPNLHNPGTADCVSCHMAQIVRLWGEKNYPQWNWKKEFEKDRFDGSKRDLSNSSVNPFQTDRVRALGYFGADPIFSQRVIHETALVADRLQSR